MNLKEYLDFLQNINSDACTLSEAFEKSFPSMKENELTSILKISLKSQYLLKTKEGVLVDHFKLALLGIVYCPGTDEEKVEALFYLLKRKADLQETLNSREEIRGETLFLCDDLGRVPKTITKTMEDAMGLSTLLLMDVHNNISKDPTDIYLKKEFDQVKKFHQEYIK